MRRQLQAWWLDLQATPSVVAAAALSCAFFLAGRLSAALISHDGRLAPVWVANAVALTALLRSERRRWPLLISGCVMGNLAMSLSSGNSLVASACMVVGNALEYSLAAVLLTRLLGPQARIDGARALLALAGVAAGVGLLAAGVIALSLHLFQGDDPVHDFKFWTLAHPLSLLLVTPCLLVLARTGEELRERALNRRATAAMALLLACVVGVFTQSQAPVLFLIPPALLLVSVESGALGAAIGVLLTAFISVAATARNLGPLALMHADVAERAAVLQLFLVMSLISSLPVAKMQARQRRLQASTLAEAERAVRAEAAASESEARYRLLAESVNDMLAVTSPADSSVEFVSQASEGVLGYRPEELIGRRSLEFTHPEDRPAVLKFFGQLVAAGPSTTPSPYQFRGRHKDGGWRWLEGQPRIIFDKAGAPLRCQDVVRDITARKTMEAELRAAHSEAQAAVEVKSQFLANMSHELRTPLTAVIGFTNLISERPELSPQTRQYVERVQTAGKALLATVNDVLDFSKLEAGQVEICPWPTDPLELVDEVVQLFGAQAEAKGLRLRTDVAAGVPPCLEIDPDRVRQVLTNLVGNAVKFTDRGAVTVGLGYGEGELRVAVTDTGGGIAADRAGLLFQRFSQIDGSNTRRHGGTGLGLAICKGLVEAMGGRIGLTSTPGHGSSFSFAIPAAAQSPAVTAPEMAPTLRLTSPRRLLLAEDNPVNRELVKALLAPYPVEIETVQDGAEAVEAAGRRPFDLILMDLHMPVMDGREAAAALRAGGPNAATPILAFSADVLQLELEAFDGMISKPISPRGLFDSLALHMGTRPAVGEPVRVAV
ncbi:ATP-binding protein [Caulobacter sp. S45]|uniref:ATP-binding protein n=1 Tax=Caulobacter sp. S45 TaxID=1641861 RepID=UPI0015773FE6|nr:ATP-binding protein [Caulobacter sp. S45]